MKVVINNCYGGFSLSPEATIRLWQMGAPIEATPVDKYYDKTDHDSPLGFKRAIADWRDYLAGGKEHNNGFLTVFSPDESIVLNTRDIPRNDKNLIQVVEEMGEKANGACAQLSVVEIPDDVEWEISEYDGNEHIAGKHRTWG